MRLAGCLIVQFQRFVPGRQCHRDQRRGHTATPTRRDGTRHQESRRTDVDRLRRGFSHFKYTLRQAGQDADLKYPHRSGSCSICEAITAVSVTCCSLTFFDRRALGAKKVPSRSLPRDVCRLTTSRSPINRDANCEVPPFSLPAQRKISVFPQFSTMVWASAAP